MSSPLILKIMALIVALILPAESVLSASGAANTWRPPIEAKTNSATVLLEDYSDIVTQTDLGFNDFSGNVGVINGQYGSTLLHCSDPQACALRFTWNFGGDLEVFTGLFHSLFGLTDTLVTFDGVNIESVSFPEHFLNLNQIDGVLSEPGGPRGVQEVCMQYAYQGAQDVTLRLELKDTLGGVRFTRLVFAGSSSPSELCWDFRNPLAYQVPPGSPDLDLGRAKVLSAIIERRHVAAGVDNPSAGVLDLHKIWFVVNRVDEQPVNDRELLDLAERRACQYFLDWSSRKPPSRGIPQDRSTFADLLTVGGVGFALPAYIICAERGWISRQETVSRTLDVLRVLDAPAAFGSENVGRIGYRGWLYHFLDIDGRRKQNFDFPATPQNERLNTVELSTIDTSLAVIGVLAAQSYFSDPSDPAQAEIRRHAQSIYERVEWPFMLDPSWQQFYLGWKPNELREGPDFEIPDAGGLGAYSGVPGNPATLDYYTDEALIVILLALGSPTFPVDPDVYPALSAYRDEAGLIRTYPGSLFTYEFLHAFLNTSSALPYCPGADVVDWYANSRQAIITARQYAIDDPKGFLTYGPDAWGISAAEGPFDAYHAYGVPPLAINSQPEEDGTVTYYAMLSAAGYGDDLKPLAVSALDAAWQRGHWQSRFGLLDAFNSEVNQAGTSTGIVRSSGPWAQHALFSIDQGPMLLHLENARSGLIQRLIASNANIQRALQHLGTLVFKQLSLEAESGAGDGQIMPRSNASHLKTVWLHASETRTVTFNTTIAGTYTPQVRYSNDNFGPLESVEVAVDGTSLGAFAAQDTGNFGVGWNVFLLSGPLGSVRLAPGNHQITVSVRGGDGYGVEIDSVQLQYFASRRCVMLPAIFTK